MSRPGGPLRQFSVIVLALILAACSQDHTPTAPAADGITSSVLGGNPEGIVPDTGSAASQQSLMPSSSVAAASDGGSLVLPNAMRSVMGDGNNFIPHSNPGIRYQQVFPASEVGGPQTIHGFCLRSDDFWKSTELEQRLEVKLGPTDLDHTNIGAVFDNNYSAPPTTVFSGTFVMPETGGGDLDSWDACLDFTTPYRHPGGSLIIEMINTSEGTINVFRAWKADFCITQPGCTTTRLWVFGTDREVASRIRRDQGLIFRFDRDLSPLTLTPLQKLQVEIQHLGEDGVLNRGQEESLLRNTRNIQRLVEQGDIDAALDQIDALIDQVTEFMSDGVLTQEQGRTLIDLARALRQAIASDTRVLAYVANQFSDNVSVIDLGTGTVTATIPTGDRPLTVAFTPDGATAYVANILDNTITVIDVAASAVTGTIPVGTLPFDIDFTPDGTTAYVANAFSNDVSVIDVAAGTVVGTIGVGATPRAVAITPDGTTALVANSFSDNVSVIDVATGTVTGTIAVGAGPLEVEVVPTGDLAYVANSGAASNNLSVIDISTGVVVATISDASFVAPRELAFTPDGSTALVTNSGAFLPGTVTIIDVPSGTVTGTIAVGSRVISVAVTPNGTTALATSPADDAVSVIDIAAGTVTATITVGEEPWGVAITPSS